MLGEWVDADAKLASPGGSVMRRWGDKEGTKGGEIASLEMKMVEKYYWPCSEIGEQVPEMSWLTQALLTTSSEDSGARQIWA